MNLLDGGYKEFDEKETVDGQKSFAAVQKKKKIKYWQKLKMHLMKKWKKMNKMEKTTMMDF